MGAPADAVAEVTSLEARVERLDGRKMQARRTASHGGEVCAEAEAAFISPLRTYPGGGTAS